MKNSPRQYLLVLFSAIVALVAGSILHAADKPNVVLILADDLG